jgi:rhamnosyltransferase
MAGPKLNIPRCSIVIRAYNEEKHLPRLLEAISEQTLKDVEVILVDSGSTDSSTDIARQHGARVLHIAREEFTFGRSLNIGVGAARGEFVVLASAHIVPMESDWLDRLLEPFEDTKVALTYGKQRGDAESKFSEDQHFRRWYPDTSNFEQKPPFSNNANAALRREMWEQQPFDEVLTGLEDLAWASWTVKQGYKVAYVAEAGVHHLHAESARQIVNRHRREAIALRQIFPNSSFSLLNLMGEFLRASLSDLRAARGQARLWKELGGILSFRWLQYWGTFRGYHERNVLTPQLKEVFYYSPRELEPSADEPGSLQRGNGASVRGSQKPT